MGCMLTLTSASRLFFSVPLGRRRCATQGSILVESSPDVLTLTTCLLWRSLPARQRPT